MKPAHSHIGASSMHRWAACPGSVKLSAPLENRSSAYAAQGTVAHDLAARFLADSNDSPDKYLGQTIKCEGFDIVVDEEMVDAVFAYGVFVGDELRNNDSSTLKTVDLKYGAGVAVEAVGNPQLKYYSLGAFLDRGKPGLLVEHKFDLTDVYPGLYGTADAVIVPSGDIKWVEMVIFQPRCNHPEGPVRRHRIPAIELLDFSTELISYARATEDPGAALHPGEHCRFCPASGICPKLRAAAQDAARHAFAPDAPYDPAVLAEALAATDLVESWVKGVREFAYAQAEAGKPPPGWKLVAKRPSRKWRDVAAAEAALKAQGLGEYALYGIPELRTVPQIEKELTALKVKPADRAAILEPIVIKESSGHALAPESDPRPPVKPSAQEAFANA